MLEWRVYYADGSTFDNLQGEPFDCPKRGALLVGQVNSDENWKVFKGGDWYIYRSDKRQWFTADIHGLIDHLLHFAPSVEAVLEGRYVTDVEYAFAYRQARLDPDIPTPSKWTGRDAEA